jgi:hypothetical protein
MFKLKTYKKCYNNIKNQFYFNCYAFNYCYFSFIFKENYILSKITDLSFNIF